MDGEGPPGRHRPRRGDPAERRRPRPNRAADDTDFLAEAFPGATTEWPVAAEPRERTEPGEPAATAVATLTSPAVAAPRPSAPKVSPQWIAPDYRRRLSLGDRFSEALPGTARRSLEAIGGLYTMFAASLYGLGADLVRRKFQFNEFVERSWFLVSVALLPAILVSVPLGVAIALQVGALAAQIGATSFVGAADAIGVLREASPIVTALLLAGVGGSAVCAELGARTIREEIDAMVVLGLNPLRRLVAPLMMAGVLVAVFLNFVVIFVSIGSAYIFDLAALHGTKGSFFGSFTQFASVADFVTSEIKAAVFGLIAVMIAAYQGLNAKRGPTGVGEAVNQSVVITGIVLFAFNLVITEIFFAVVPQRTF